MKYSYRGTITASLTRQPSYSIDGHIDADNMIDAAKSLMPKIQDMVESEREVLPGFDHALEQCVELTLTISSIPPARTSTAPLLAPVQTTRV